MRCRKEVCFFVKGVMKKSKTFCFAIFGIFLSVFCGFLGAKMMFWMFVLSGRGRESA